MHLEFSPPPKLTPDWGFHVEIVRLEMYISNSNSSIYVQRGISPLGLMLTMVYTMDHESLEASCVNKNNKYVVK